MRFPHDGFGHQTPYVPPAGQTRNRRGAIRLGLGLGVLVALAAVLVATLATLSRPPGRPLDPSSSSKDGSHALARLLRDRGVAVHRTTALTDLAAGHTVLVAFPDDYSTEQLRALMAAHRLVVVGPGPTTLRAIAPTLTTREVDGDVTTVSPGCPLPGPQASGAVDFPSGTQVLDGAACYSGRVSIAAGLVVLGSDRLLRNDELAHPGVAALDINALSADGTGHDVDWLLPGADAHGNGSPSIWLVLPSWAPRATVWALLVGLLVALWRGRRLGPVVVEPLPVVVHSAEVVEGHGRLYRRAAARDRAAAELRGGALRRLRTRLSLPRDATPHEVAAAAARAGGRPAADVPAIDRILAGAPPTDDAMLIDLARALDDLAAHPAGEGTDP